jgi:hypothetical protein
MFAKLYEDEEIGQILITKETVEVEEQECPGLRLQLSAEGLRFGVEIPYPNSERGFEIRDRAFGEFTEERAVDAAKSIIQEIIDKAEEEENEESDGTGD